MISEQCYNYILIDSKYEDNVRNNEEITHAEAALRNDNLRKEKSDLRWVKKRSTTIS